MLTVPQPGRYVAVALLLVRNQLLTGLTHVTSGCTLLLLTHTLLPTDGISTFVSPANGFQRHAEPTVNRDKTDESAAKPISLSLLERQLR